MKVESGWFHAGKAPQCDYVRVSSSDEEDARHELAAGDDHQDWIAAAMA
jgi:hypothetical protein